MFYRFFLLLIICSSFIQRSPLNAQVSIGVNAGLNRSSFSGDPPSKGTFDPVVGPNAALRLDYRFKQAIAISLQPGYTSQGANYVGEDSNYSVSDSLEFRFSALAFPLHAIIWSENGRFFVSAGLEFDFYLNASAYTEERSTDIKSEIKSYNIFAQFGGGFMISLGRSYLLFELRYSQGLIDINNTQFQEEAYLPRTKFKGIYFLAGFHFPLGKESHYKIHK